jgi:broad specificity phosphatase PhoE
VTTILLARHGETDWNRAGRFQGQADPPLNERGRAQAARLASEVAHENIAAVYASDLRRALETAEIVGSALRVSVEASRELREVDVGRFAGLTGDEVDERWPELRAVVEERGYAYAAGESFESVRSRLVRKTSQIAARHPKERVLVVGHGAAIRALLAYVEGLDLVSHRRLVPPLGNGAVERIRVVNGEMVRVD